MVRIGGDTPFSIRPAILLPVCCIILERLLCRFQGFEFPLVENFVALRFSTFEQGMEGSAMGNHQGIYRGTVYIRLYAASFPISACDGMDGSCSRQAQDVSIGNRQH